MIVKEISIAIGEHFTQRGNFFEDFASIITKFATVIFKNMANIVMEYITFIVICAL